MAIPNTNLRISRAWKQGANAESMPTHAAIAAVPIHGSRRPNRSLMRAQSRPPRSSPAKVSELSRLYWNLEMCGHCTSIGALINGTMISSTVVPQNPSPANASSIHWNRPNPMVSKASSIVKEAIAVRANDEEILSSV